MYYINPHIKNLYRVKYDNSRIGALRLDMNESPGGLPETFVEEVKAQITPDFLSMYPEKGRLTKMLAAYHQISDRSLTITSGSDEAMRLIFQCFGEPGKQALSAAPTFELYGVYAKMFAMEYATVAYQPDFALPLEELLSRISNKTGIVILLNPNSPIGNCWRENAVRTVIERAGAVGAVVIIDEAYHYFCPATFFPLIREYRNVLVLRTFSKLYACAGLRIGYAAGDEQLVQYLERAESTFNVNRAAILFAEELLRRPEIGQTLAAAELEGRRWLAGRMASAGYPMFCGEGNYILLRPRRHSAEIVSRLKDRGIWIRDYTQGILSGWLRVTTGDKKYMERFWRAFSEIDGAVSGRDQSL